MNYSHQDYINKNKRVEAPSFRIGDWVINVSHNNRKPFRLDSYRGTGGGHIQLWVPAEGDVVICWDRSGAKFEDMVIGKVINHFEDLAIRGSLLKSWGNVIPYIGQDFSEMR